MFPPDRRARGMSFVLFGAVSGAIWGPVIFGPLFSHRAISAHGLTGPWLLGIPFMLAGLAISLFVKPDPKEISARYGTPEEAAVEPAPVRTILRRPGVPSAVLAVIASFAVMASVMNLAYTAAGVTALAFAAAALAAVPALWIGSSRFRYTAAPADT
jgi:MFS family permease